MLELLAERGIELAGAFYCPHPPDAGCPCRKPSPEQLLQAARELDLDLARSYMVGDKESDVEAGRRAGCVGMLVSRNGNDWSAVAEKILDGEG